jgi:cell wall-associated NlpC family hydrolase
VKLQSRIACILAAAALVGCAHTPQRPPSYTTGTKIDMHDSSTVHDILYAQYYDWKGVKYEIGGLSRHGIDCSGFVYVTFKSKLGIVLPRTTEAQVEKGKSVDKDELRPGDLVFFKTGWFERHVGIYVGHGRFLHASTSSGVTISRLGDSYWKSAYWKARRIGA